MIFVTVGTTKFPFDRLLKAVDEAMEKIGGGEELIVQKGKSDYQFKYPNAKVFEEISYEQMIFYLKRARWVISHGGPATIFLALKYRENSLIIVPRRKKFGEHTDDHQFYFAKFLGKKKKGENIFFSKGLSDKITDCLKKTPQKSRDKGSKKKAPSELQQLTKKLIDYSQSIS